MADRQETHFKRPQSHLVRPSSHDRHRIGGHTMLLQFPPGDIGREGAAVNWGAQPGIGMADRSHMVFMCMCNEHAINAVFARLEPRNIRNNQVNPGGAVHIWKGHAKINDN